MKKMSNKIVFFGSGPVAAESLRLLQQHEDIEAVVTKKSTEREMSAVAEAVPVLTANNKSELDSLISKQGFESRLGVLIDFGIIISQAAIDSFELGIINSHFSILPEWRGADPITFAILSGQEMTGVSLMMLVQAMDEGPLVSYGEQPLDGSETGLLLTNKLIKLSDALLQENIPRVFSGESKGGAPQSITNRSVSYSRKLTKEDGVLDFHKTAKELEAEIRAFIEWPKSRTEIAGKDVVVTSAIVDTELTGKVGEVFKTADKKIGIYTSEGALIVLELKPAGKKTMPVEAFLAGYGSRL
jgi:methionyl-tRNA formyltransferase